MNFPKSNQKDIFVTILMKCQVMPNVKLLPHMLSSQHSFPYKIYRVENGLKLPPFKSQFRPDSHADSPHQSPHPPDLNKSIENRPRSAYNCVISLNASPQLIASEPSPYPKIHDFFILPSAFLAVLERSSNQKEEKGLSPQFVHAFAIPNTKVAVL